MSNYIKKNQSHFSFKSFISSALKEDIGNGDHTSLSTIPPNHIGKMRLLVKENGILAGVEAAREIVHHYDKSIKFIQKLKDGTQVKPGDIAFYLEGKSQKLVTIERLVLNVMQRMSGIATKTHRMQSLCNGTKAKLIDTRKTTPGFRFFEKWAVVIGGGANHRYGLYDMILIKDNHIDFCGDIDRAIEKTKSYLQKKKLKIPIEVEARTLNDVKRIAKHKGIYRILLDNFSPVETAKAVKLINGKIRLESSGGITEKNIRKYALCGVNYISVGALTHHVKSLDLSLKAI